MSQPETRQETLARVLGIPDTRGTRRLVVGQVVDTLGTGMFLPLSFYFFTVSTSLPTSGIGLAFSSATAMALLAAPAAGSLTDRWGPRPVVVLSNLLTAGGYVLYPTVSNYAGLFACVLVVMLADRLYFASWPTLISAIARRGELDSWFALAQATNRGALGVGALLSSLVIAGGPGHSLRTLMYLNVASSVAAAALIASVRLPAGSVAPEPSAPSGGWMAVLNDQPFRRLIAVQGLMSFAWTLPTTFLPLYVVKTLGLPAWQPMLIFGTNCLLLLAAQTRLTHRMRRVRRTRAMLGGAVMIVVSLILVGVASVVRRPLVMAPLMLGAVAFTFGEMLCAPAASALAAAIAPERLRGRYLSLFELTGSIGFGLGPGLVGLLYAIDPRAVLVGLGVFVTAGAVTLVVSDRALPSSLPESWGKPSET